jgi:hypothetical protein
MATLGNLVVGITANTTGFRRGLAQVQSATNSISKGKLLQGGGGFGGLESSLTGSLIKANLLISAMKALGQVMSKTIMSAADAEMTKLTLEVLSGNKGQGISLFQELEKIAQQTTLTLGDTTAAAKQLLVSFDATQIPYLVKMLGNISSGMDNVSLQEMAFLLQTSHEEGKLLQRDLRQFTTRGIPVNKELQEILGLFGPDAGAKLNEMITAGDVKFTHLFQALDKLSKKWNMLEVQGKTLTGRWNQMQDAIEFAARDFGEMLVNALDLKNVIKTVTDWISDFRANLWKMQPIIQMMADGFWSMIGAIGRIVKLLGMKVFGFFGIQPQDLDDILMTLVAAFKFVWDNIERIGQFILLSIQSFILKIIVELEDIFNAFVIPLEKLGIDIQPIDTHAVDKLWDVKEDLADLKMQNIGAEFITAMGAALLKLWNVKQPEPAKALGAMKPFDNNLVEGTGAAPAGDNGALMQGTQGAWDAIMKAMSADPVVNAIKVQTRQQANQDAAQRRLLQRIADKEAKLLNAFPGAGIF